MIRKYKRGDALRIDVQKEQADEAKECRAFFDEIEAFTLVDDKGKILAVMGYRIIKDRAECFALLGKTIKIKMIELVRFIKCKIKIESIKKKISKIFITVKVDFDNAKRMAEMLGFRQVARLPLFFNGKDYLLYEKRSEYYGVHCCDDIWG